MTVALILAAGRSSRMGQPKALLRHADGVTTFLAHAVRTMRAAGLTTAVVVGRAEDGAVRDEAVREGATFVANPDPDRGQLSSLLAGLDVAERWDAEAVIVLPVDVPTVGAPAIRRLLEAASFGEAPILRAASGGRHGHPVIFKRAVFGELRSADPAAGAKSVVRAEPSRVVDVETGDEGVTFDVDTPEDYRRAFGRPL